MLNYLGPSIGPNGPIGNQLPTPTPGTMPSAVPHGAPPAPLPPPPSHGIHGPPPSHGIHGPAPVPPSALAAIMNRPPAQPGALPEPPAPPDYSAVTQEDGSILLHIKNPDGSLGPAVKVIPPIKRPS